MTPTTTAAAVLAAVLIGATASGCAAKESATDSAAVAGTEVSVDATDTECALSSAEATAGPVTFAVTNNGTKVTELYVYGPGGGVVDEVENISPGLKRDLKVELAEPGTYVLACKPGMVGDGIRTDFTVKG